MKVVKEGETYKMFYLLSEERQGNKIVKEFVCDDCNDLQAIQEVDFGDIAIVAKPPSVYLYNSQKEWVIL